MTDITPNFSDDFLPKTEKVENLREQFEAAQENLNLQKMEDYGKRLLKYEPHNTDVEFKTGVAQFNLNNFDGAIKMFSGLLQDDSNNLDGIKLLGFSYQGNEDYSQAVIVFQDGIAKFPNDAELKLGLAECLCEEEKYKQAEDMVYEAQLDDPNINSDIVSGQLEEVKGNKQTALEYYSREIKKIKGDGDEYFNSLLIKVLGKRANLELGMGDSSAYLADLREIQKLDPENEESAYLQTRMKKLQSLYDYRDSGNNKKVIELSNEILKNEENYELYFEKAFAEAHLDLFNEAIKDYEKAIDLNPDNSAAHNNLGLLYEDENNQMALNEFNTAINENPDSILYLTNRAELEEQMGMIQDAKKDYKTILRLDGNSQDASENLHKLKKNNPDFKVIAISVVGVLIGLFMLFKLI